MQLKPISELSGFETEEDRTELWDLFIKNRGCTFNNHRSELLNYGKRISPNLDRNKGEIYG